MTVEVKHRGQTLLVPDGCEFVEECTFDDGDNKFTDGHVFWVGGIWHNIKDISRWPSKIRRLFAAWCALAWFEEKESRQAREFTGQIKTGCFEDFSGFAETQFQLWRFVASEEEKGAGK